MADMLRVSIVPTRRILLSETRVTPIDQRHSALLMLLTALLMAAASVLGATAVYAQDEETAAEPPAAEEATTDEAASDEAAAAGGIDGTWTVDRDIGSSRAPTPSPVQQLVGRLPRGRGVGARRRD